MAINIGKYNQRITFQGYSEEQNSYGEVVRTYTDLYTRWAQVKPTAGIESIQADEKVASRTAKFWVRQQGININEIMRIVWNNQTFDIISIDEFGTNLRDGYEIVGVSKDSQ